jgi:hypothetical protein
LSVTAAIVHAVLHAVAQVFISKLLAKVVVRVSDTVTVFGSMLPIFAGPVDVDWPVDGDVVSTPVTSTAPVIATPRPASEAIPDAKRNSRRDDASRNVAGGRKVIRRIIRIRPISVDDRRFIIRHINRVRLSRLYDDDLFVLFLLLDYFLLLGRCQFIVGICLRAQSLNGIHHVGLLGQYGVAKFQGPIKF